ncbi:MAG: PD-(D/E)XK nuclease family protein, partial [Treponemataceae bacterium]|nr:PD-(D/E)XK nuclease family protein [Treponemataceae bacterium]
QEKDAGVSVFSYRLAAEAAYPFRFVINCTQKALTVPFRTLPFLNNEKRRALDITDSDEASSAFIRLYGAWNGAERGRTVFSCAEQSFAGFSIPHTYFEAADCPAGGTPFSELDGGDFFLAERNWLLGGRRADAAPSELTDMQRRGFFRWRSCAAKADGMDGGPASDAVRRKVGALFARRSGRLGGAVPAAVSISQDDMKDFFPCPRKWLFKKALFLHEDTLDAELLSVYEPGSVNHKILELVFSDFQKNGAPLPVTEADGTFGAVERSVRALVARCAREAIHSPEMAFHGSPLVLAMLDSQQQQFERTVCDFLHSFCSSDKDGFGGFTVHSTERRFCAQTDGGYALFGRTDCILCGDDGAVSIVDYKNSAASVPSISSCRVREDGALENFQIAMYVALWSASSCGSVPVERAAVCSVSGGRQSVVVDGRDGRKTMEQFEPTLRAFRLYCGRFAEKVSSGRLEPVSRPSSIFENLDAYSDCAACDFRAVCRTTFQIAGNALPHGAAEEE